MEFLKSVIAAMKALFKSAPVRPDDGPCQTYDPDDGVVAGDGVVAEDGVVVEGGTPTRDGFDDAPVVEASKMQIHGDEEAVPQEIRDLDHEAPAPKSKMQIHGDEM